MAALPGKTVALGSPQSPTHKIDPIQLADWMTEYEALAGSNGISYIDGTLSALSARAGTADGEYGLVINNLSEAGVYERISGTWTKKADIPSIFTESLAADQAAASASAAAASASAAAVSVSEAAASASEAAASASAAAASESGAETSRTQAELAATAAGATIYDSIANGLAGTTDGDVFLVSTEPGVQVYRNDTGSETFLGWLGEILFDDVAALLADTGSFAEGAIIRTRKKGFSYQVAASGASDHDVTTAGGVKLYVLKAGDGAYHTDAWGISPGVDESTKFDAALAKAANGTLVINFNVAAYIGDRLIPAANTTIKFEPGTVYKAKAGGTRAIQIQQENVHVWGYGARVELDGSQNSHAVLITGGGSSIAKNCSVRGLHAKGSGNSGDDCFYIGGDVANDAIPENIQIIDCKGEGLGAGTRNCLSVVACDGYLIEGCEFWNATGAPGAGIDLEANLYKTDGTSAIRRGIIRRNKVHSCDSGIVSVFADDCIIEDNEVYGNAGDGIGSAAGGTQFDDAIYRTGDRLGVISFASDGWITVEDTNLLTDDLGIEVGTVVGRRTESGAAWPAEFTTTNYIVNEISADQFSFRIGTDFDCGTITSITGSGTGTLDKDPTVSDMHFNVYRAGNNSNMTIRRNIVYGNGSSNSQIKLSQMVNVIIDGNIVTAGTTSAINVTYSQNVRAEKNRCQPAVLSTSVGRGINIGVCSEVSTRKNRLYGFGGEGLGLSGSQVESDGDIVLNCGHSVNRSARFQFGTGMVIRSIIVRNDTNYPSSAGLRLENTVNDSVVIGARCKDAGADNDSSLVIAGTNVRAVDCMVNDGTFYGEKSITWNAPSIANGASNTTPHTFTGTRPGDFVIATLENNTAGLSVSASAYNNGVRVTVTNNTGGAVDLAETTLRLKRMPRS